MTLAREALLSLDKAIVPLVYGWAGGRNDVSEWDGHGDRGWVVMELMPGTPLKDKFPLLSEQAKKDVLDQVAVILKAFQTLRLPDSAVGYGGFNFDGAGNIIVGATAIPGGGPCNTYPELYAAYLKTELEIADKCDIVKGWRETGLRSRIDKFATERLVPLLSSGPDAQTQPTYVHGDLGKSICFARCVTGSTVKAASGLTRWWQIPTICSSMKRPIGSQLFLTSISLTLPPEQTSTSTLLQMWEASFGQQQRKIQTDFACETALFLDSKMARRISVLNRSIGKSQSCLIEQCWQPPWNDLKIFPISTRHREYTGLYNASTRTCLGTRNGKRVRAPRSSRSLGRLTSVTLRDF